MEINEEAKGGKKRVSDSGEPCDFMKSKRVIHFKGEQGMVKIKVRCKKNRNGV